MPTARSYDRYSLDGEPFKENGRMYVYVMMPNGNKKVRWYTEAERAAQDRKAGIEPQHKSIMDFNAKHAFGFDDLGFITVYKGDANVIQNFAEEHREYFWRNMTFGYYTPSSIEPCTFLPDNITPIKLKWEEVQDYDTRMRPHEEVAKYVANLCGMATSTSSEYQGEEGQWLEETVSIRENQASDTQFGSKYTHYMVDSKGNTYVWATGTKNYPCGATIKLKMRVKAHKEINGEKCTIVWYCKEI